MNAALLRNKAIRAAREFFAGKNILEVMTPKAVVSPALEPYIDAIALASTQNEEKLFLATSPEFALKKIFAAEMAQNTTARGIYEIAPVFRDDRPGKNHALEFTMVEWYARDTTLGEILETAAELFANIAEKTGSKAVPARIETMELREIFSRAQCAFDFADETSVVQKYQSLHGSLPHHLNTTDAAIACFNLLFDEYALPLIRQSPYWVAVSGYPSYLGALSFTEGGIAQRAEIFYRGLELANGYREEFRPDMARERWLQYNTIRNLRKIEAHRIDEDLLAHLPEMAGVAGIAVGLERVLMALFPGLAVGDFAQAADASNLLP